jgi:flagellar hook assembly protein FlgD
LSVYDVNGRFVKQLVNEVAGPGTFATDWDGTNENGEHVSTGVYFCRLIAGSFTETQKMVLLK